MSKTKKPLPWQTLTINRKRWLRGVKNGGSYLRHPNNQKQCCLGFYARECGLKAADINGISTPDGLRPKHFKAVSRLFEPYSLGGDYEASTVEENPITCKLMETNDDSDQDYTEHDREAEIKKLFAKLRVRVRFVG